jgi:hypothetical protein
MTIAGSEIDTPVCLNRSDRALDRIHGMKDVIGEKPSTGTSPMPDFDAADEDRYVPETIVSPRALTFRLHSWLFEELNRDEAISALQHQSDGTFLVRPSGTIKGDLVLCVK